MKTYLYQIETISNLHVGSGEINQGVVDNLVQRDPVTGFPMINASSLKGALRQYFNEHCPNIVNHVFGSPIRNNRNNNGNGNDNNLAGAYRFFDARMLSMPVRSDKRLFLMATCPMLLNDYYNTIRMFVSKTYNGKACNIVEKSPLVGDKMYAGARIEDINQISRFDTNADFSELTDKPSVLLSDEALSMLCDNDHLPIVARNHLNNGQSKNLWYEQVIPRFSRMYFAVAADEEYFSEFEKELCNSLIQIGGNASVGNGVCKISKVNI